MSTTFQETRVAAKAPAVRGYVSMSLHVIRAMDPFGFDVYVSDGDGRRPLLFRAHDCEFGIDQAETLHRHHTQWFYIRAADKATCNARLHAHLDAILHRDDIPPAERYQVLLSAVSLQLQSAFQRLHVDAAVEESTRVGNHIAQLVSQSEFLPTDLMAVAQHNTDTFVHILNTAGYAVCLAGAVGMQDPLELQRIAVGAMLHDVGKRFLPKQLIGGSSRLTREERALLEEHPQKGYEELHDRRDLAFEQLMMVYQHHERVDGRGYPVGVLGKEIHPWARLCGVVDIFEAITGKRSYRAAISADAALAELDAMAGTRLDEEMVWCWRSVITQRS
jgi:HD-GYP domain-containing protein (c-di-GMP phosphodiesterase class II)